MRRRNPYREKDHGGFDEEWLPHRGASGWWYVTGYVRPVDEPDRLYSYQFTVVNPVIGPLAPFVLQLALTDIAEGRHYFKQQLSPTGRMARVDDGEVSFGALARLRRQPERMLLDAGTEDFGISLRLSKGKGAFWHGDGGVLVMGLPAERRQRTVYYSYTNMPTEGELRIGGRTFTVAGKSWMDRQWGPFTLFDPRTHWEWFSLRFYDDEEVMLFSFPQDACRDGTYVDGKGAARRIPRFDCTPLGTVDVGGLTFSRGWRVALPGIRQERYEIRPLSDGQFNLGYYELLAGIYGPGGREEGLCFVELLPGARTPKEKIGWKTTLTLFKKA